MQGLVRVLNGNREVCISRLACAARNQRVMIVPVPHFAKASFYRDWVYQPYVAEHQILFSYEIVNMLGELSNKTILLESNGELERFVPDKMPAAELSGITPLESKKKLTYVGPSPLRATFVPASWRRYATPWVGQRLKAFLGAPSAQASERYRSVVCLISPFEAVAAADVLAQYGFVEEERVWVDIGAEGTLATLERRGYTVLDAMTFYVWALLLIVVGSISREALAESIEQAKKTQRELANA